MYGKVKQLVLICIGIIIIVMFGILIKNYFNKPTNIVMQLDNKHSEKSEQRSELRETGLKEEKVDVYFEGSKVNLTSPIYMQRNRYYIPLNEVIYTAKGKIFSQDNQANIKVNGNEINLNTKESYYTLNGNKVNLRKRVILSGNIVYMSLFDLAKMLNLKVDWNIENNIVALFWNKDKLTTDKQPQGGKTALIRFEDITAAQRYSSAESLEKIRIITDYCYSRNIPLHLGWVPRYIDPNNNIDNEPSEKNSMYNADFIYTLDYFVDKNGIIGLHGYTHQHGQEVSIDATEFSNIYNTSEKDVRDRLEHAISDAKKLEIPIKFFESPHYTATLNQKRIMEQYFDNIYEFRISGMERNITKVNVGNRQVKYIPTPLDYVNGKDDTDHMIKKIKSLRGDSLGSFFFHPSIEFDFIKIKKDNNGYPSYEYLGDSPLHRIINTFIDNGYTFKSIDSL